MRRRRVIIGICAVLVVALAFRLQSGRLLHAATNHGFVAGVKLLRAHGGQ